MSDINWNEKADYLMQTRGLYLNDDYLAFLVRHVWGLDSPTEVIDFGCGFGYMGLKLLPLLPAGSAYTGVDLADGLLAKAREIFNSAPYRTEFVQADVTEAELPARHYDLAVCHALLLHTPNPVAVLKQMKRCVKPGGLVICIEPHWIGSMAKTYYHGGPQSAYVKLGILQRLYEKDAERSGKDGNIGIKVPLFMDEVGLTDIACRMSDRVNLLLPHQDPARQKQVMESLQAEGFGSAPQDRAIFQERLMARGLSAEEAEKQYESECAFAARYVACGATPQAVFAPGMMICYGRVPAANA
ncbi:MAG TPA: class I SAM-dependent methyltransferase [Symbiobacteriaceae bacterium]|nr:class I SAM-dependent methyltransferase [Symbiobacteriaceae bacterium]